MAEGGDGLHLSLKRAQSPFRDRLEKLSRPLHIACKIKAQDERSQAFRQSVAWLVAGANDDAIDLGDHLRWRFRGLHPNPVGAHRFDAGVGQQ